MKRILALIFSSILILGACGSDDTSNNNSDTKSENKTEKKSEDKKDNKSKEDKKSKEENKTQENEDNKSTQEDNSTEEQNTQETATNEQVQSQQPATQEQQQTQQANQQNYNDQQSYHEPTKDEIYEWDKQNIPGGTDYGLIDPEDVNEPSDSQNEEPDEWIKGQEEWANATQSEKEEIRKRDAEKYGYEYDPSDYEE